MKVLSIQEKDGGLKILVRDEDCGFESTITDLDLDIVLGHLEGILDELPNI